MAIKLNSTDTEIELVWPGDPAIDAENSDLRAYRNDPAAMSAHIVFREGEDPTIFVVRPLDADQSLAASERGMMKSKSGNAYVQNLIRNREALATGLVRITNIPGAKHLEGKGGRATALKLPMQLASDMGVLILNLSEAHSSLPAAIESVFDTIEGVKGDVETLLEELDALDATLSVRGRDAIECLRERLKLAPGETLHPSEDAEEDLPK